jgi:hypothetical protein
MVPLGRLPRLGGGVAMTRGRRDISHAFCERRRAVMRERRS